MRNYKKEDKKDKEIEEKKEIKCSEVEVDETYKDCHKEKNDDHQCKKYIDYNEYENRIEEVKELDPYNFNMRGCIGEFFGTVAKDFEPITNKFKDIKFCKWYKVNVDSLEDMMDTSDYNKYTIAYYPMINYYPYFKVKGYFLLGYKCDESGELKYIVYGISGSKDITDQPYAGKTGFVTWMESGDNDEDGFWLMFYDYKNSTVVVPTK